MAGCLPLRRSREDAARTGWGDLGNDTWGLILAHVALTDLARVAHLHSSLRNELQARLLRIRKACTASAVDLFGWPCFNTLLAVLDCFLVKVPNSDVRLRISLSGEVHYLNRPFSAELQSPAPGIYVDVFVWPRIQKCKNNLCVQFVSPVAADRHSLCKKPVTFSEAGWRYSRQEIQARFGILALVGEAVNRVPRRLKHRMRQLMLKPHGCILGRPQAGRIWATINKSMCRMGLDRTVLQSPPGDATP